jgi:hypothetical protein
MFPNHIPVYYKIAFTLAVLLVLACVPDMLIAQGGGPILPPPPDQAPIDGGLSILAAAGGAYAIKKIRDKKE